MRRCWPVVVGVLLAAAPARAEPPERPEEEVVLEEEPEPAGEEEEEEEENEEEEERSSTPPEPPVGPPRVWLTLGLQQHVAWVSSNGVCTRKSQLENGYACFRKSGSQYHGTPAHGHGGEIGPGLVFATSRVSLGSHLRLGDSVSLGLQLGYAVLGRGSRPDGGKAFLPLLAELRGSWWLSGAPFDGGGFAPFLFASGGVAEVDAKKEVPVSEDTGAPPPSNQTDNPPTQKLEAQKKMGAQFAGVGVGAVLPLGDRSGIVVDLGSSFFFPDTGTVFTLGAAYAAAL